MYYLDMGATEKGNEMTIGERLVAAMPDGYDALATFVRGDEVRSAEAIADILVDRGVPVPPYVEMVQGVLRYLEDPCRAPGWGATLRRGEFVTLYFYRREGVCGGKVHHVTFTACD